MADPYRRRIVQLITEHRPDSLKADGSPDLKRLSLAIGKNETYMQQFLKKGSPRFLPEGVRISLADYLGVNETELRPSDAPPKVEDKPRDSIADVVKISAPPLGNRDLPVLGTMVGGNNGDFYMNGQAHAYVVRPENLRTVTDAYAVYIQGDSMEPAAYAGQIAYVHPHKPPTTNNLVVIELQSGAAFIKQYVKRTATRLIARELQPQVREITFELSEVKNIHRIVLLGDDLA